ncbi:MAG: adenylyltransferase/cytidyltransferase family protein [Candidatus Omnitrophica bacterium]|nr:adenylyltransferase/cytidyltransferase family protein [Candidatus Omnitrophota bacterium]MDD5081244.1 adenylyltransferase/cytidyltransferase family protein [Candidatus Omnitrophota bacterium]MDD5441315.1 adenylyltransferase/cytidyltransferase family protein [Candidatus Omnitrophota bacterium]
MNKIKPLIELIQEIDNLKTIGKKIVFTNGCFDIIHAGHIKVFREAKAKGDVLVVGLNSDISIQSIKGNKRPIIEQSARAEVIEALDMVDYIVFFDDDTPYETIKAIKPDYLVKGGDWKKEDIIGSDLVKDVVSVSLKEGFSTTSIINKILNVYG